MVKSTVGKVGTAAGVMVRTTRKAGEATALKPRKM